MDMNETNENAMGGTEIMARGLEARVDPGVLKHFQIIQSRVRDIDGSRIPIYWLHDLPGDSESEHLANGGWEKFDRLVYVSNWQAQEYQSYYGIPWHKGVVMLNAIAPIAPKEKTRGKIKIIYHSTPHRGLNLLISAFEQLCEKYDDVQLDVFSSFKLYGWEERDKQYKALFDRCKAHPKINYHGTQSNEFVRQALAEAHIFAYPSIWPETSCLCLMEAMSAGCLCIHPNYAALYETAANCTRMYQYLERAEDHATMMHRQLVDAVDDFWTPGTQAGLARQTSYANTFYSWDVRARQWDRLLRGILREKRIAV